MKHELDDGTILLNPDDGSPYTEDQRYGFFVGLEEHIRTQYKRDRKYAYPPIEEQLDMLWHAMDNDEFKKIEPFYSAIKQVKDRFPK